VDFAASNFPAKVSGYLPQTSRCKNVPLMVWGLGRGNSTSNLKKVFYKIPNPAKCDKFGFSFLEGRTLFPRPLMTAASRAISEAMDER
jgi:hypothetical protein